MKPLLMLSLLLTLVACDSIKNLPSPPSTKPTTPVVSGTPTVEEMNLPWHGSKYYKETWDEVLIDELVDADIPASIPSPCVASVPRALCFAHLLSKLSERESSFNPNTKYNETGHLAGVVSRGLFQLSLESAQQSAYKCDFIKTIEDLHVDIKNIKCAVRVFAYQTKKYKVVLNGKEESGTGRYWSPGRSSSSFYKTLEAYVKGLK